VWIRRLIPNLFTAGNLVGGILAIILTLTGHIYLAPFFIFISAILDFLDGFIARALKVESEIGKQLDSLADMVTFGVAPGIIVFVLLDLPNGLVNLSIIQSTHDAMLWNCIEGSCSEWDLFIGNELLVDDGISFTGENLEYRIENQHRLTVWPSFLAFIIPVFALFRLAKFNIDTKQKDSFIGLPTPAMTVFFVSIPVLLFISSATLFTDSLPTLFLLSPNFLIPSTIIMSVLMVVNLPLFSLKFKTFKWKENQLRYIFLTISLILLATLFWWALPIIIVLYIILSLFNNLFKKSEVDEIQS
jgi:CDP-diacylglycerol---serine O-phosphatidyltransferase